MPEIVVSFQKGEELFLRPITKEDEEFLFRLFASTRLEEMAATGWSGDQIEIFLRQQFRLQHTQYTQNYPNTSFRIICHQNHLAGRLYISRGKKELRIMDIALLPKFRRQGIGTKIMGRILEQADADGLTVSLHVEQNNPILPFYETLGFEKIDLRGIYYYLERKMQNNR